MFVLLSMWMALADVDNDHDGFGSAEDCDDSRADAYPWAPELCNGLDDNCDGGFYDWELDSDADGVALCAGDCDDTDAGMAPGLEEVADGLDNNCDARTDEGTEFGDDDLDGFSERMPGSTEIFDCDDADPAIHPGAAESPPNGLDDDCDLRVDEGDLDQDLDQDGYASLDGDCDDKNPTIFPGAVELPGSGDQNCDGQADVAYGCEEAGYAFLLPLPLLLRRRRSPV